MKVCNRCNIGKPLIEYHIRRDSKDGYRNTCKECRNKQHSSWRKNQHEHRIKIQKKFRKGFIKKYGIHYDTLHYQIRKIKEEPMGCEICGNSDNLELSSIRHTYTLNPKDYQYLCHTCHNKYDIKLRKEVKKC